MCTLEGRPVKGHTLTVALCTYQRAAVLGEALESLCVQEIGDPSCVEVLVVDNGSTDGTSELALGYTDRVPFRLRVVVEPQKGLSYARNRAIREAEGDIVAYLDDDAVAEPGWAAGHLEAYDSDPDVCGVMGRIYPRWGAPRPAWLDPMLEVYLTIADFGDEPFVLRFPEHSPIGANMSFTRQALVDAGMFNPEFGVGGPKQIPYEENEVAHRMYQRGAKMVCWPSAAVWHGVPAARMTVRWFWRRILSQGRAECVFDAEHHGRGRMLSRALKGLFCSSPVLTAAAVADFVVGNRARAARRGSVPVFNLGYLQESVLMMTPGAKEVAR